jgi:hypothetical protein
LSLSDIVEREDQNYNYNLPTLKIAKPITTPVLGFVDKRSYLAERKCFTNWDTWKLLEEDVKSENFNDDACRTFDMMYEYESTVYTYTVFYFLIKDVGYMV